MRSRPLPTLPFVLLATLAACSPAAEPTAGVQKVHGDLQFTEGPADDGKGNVYFTDVAGNRIHRHGADGKFEVFLDPSGHCNGLMFNAAGTLFACEMDGRLIAIDPRTKDVTSLADEYEGKRFNAPNDLVLDKEGGVYFTDPRFRAPEPWPQGKEAVYYRAADGKVTRLVDDLPAPNGVILSIDEQTLYVVPSLQKQMLAYPVQAPGKLGEGRVFCELKQAEGADNGGGDGLTIDVEGSLYITSKLGVQVFDKTGKFRETLVFPEQPANVTFAGEGRKTLFVTARTGVYTLPRDVAGHAFPGKAK
jgi:gluconolactonase